MVAWAVALAVWHFGRIEEKWNSGLAGVDTDTEALLQAELDMTLDQELAQM